ncbi:MAG: hypothetical protein GY710_13725 [Desulfobacteraceae bacterium]|nr:hypothetical protein [Desulfobacteraceae bacterium]
MNFLDLRRYENKQYEFHTNHDLIGILIVRYTNFIVMVGALLILGVGLFFYFWEEPNNIRFITVPIKVNLFCFPPVLILNYLFWRKRAFKVIFKENSIEIFKYLKKISENYDLTDLKLIEIDFFMSLKFKDAIIIKFRDGGNLEYYKFLKKTGLPITFGKIGKFRFRKHLKN